MANLPGPTLSPGLAGIPIVQSTTDRGAQFPNPIVNQRVQNLTTRAFERWDGTQWITDPLTGAFDVTNFGAQVDGTTDDTAAIQQALTTAGAVAALLGGIVPVTVPLSTTPALISGHLSIPAYVDLSGPGAIKAKSGFADSYMFLIDVGATGARVSVHLVDGSGCPVPVAAWTGAGSGTARAPVGCAVFINGNTSGGNVTDCVIGVDTFQNFPSGPICAFSADNLVVSCRKFYNNQTYTGGETNGVVTAFDSNAVTYNPGVIDTYKWKGWYFGRCTNSKGFGNVCKNGVNGQASHYDASGVGNVFMNASQEGTGYGYKAFQSARSQVIGFTSKGSGGGAVFFDSCIEPTLDGLTCIDPSSPGIVVQADAGITQHIRIRNWHVTRTTQGTTTNHTAITIQGGATYAIDDVDIDAGTADNGLFGIYSPAVANAVVSNVRIGDGVTFTNQAQYDVFLKCQSADVNGKVIRSATSASSADVAIGTQSGVAGTRCRVGNLSVDINGNSEIGCVVGGTWDVVTVEGLKTRGGGFPFQLDNGAQIGAASVGHLNLALIHAFNASQPSAVTLNFTTAVTTKLTVGNVQLPISGGGARNINVAISGGAVVQGYGVQTLTDAATIVTDGSTVPYPTGNCQVTLGGNRTLQVPSPARVGQRIAFTIIQDGTGGRTLTLGTGFKGSWSDTGNTAGKRSTIAFFYDGTNWNQDGAQTPYA